MKFFKTEQIKAIDIATINNEPITSIELMERAATKLTDAIIKKFGKQKYLFAVFAGGGNNGGDALAVARMLQNHNEKVSVWLIASNGNLSPDCQQNLTRLQKEYKNSINILHDGFINPYLPDNTIIIDGIFGCGLNKPIKGIFAKVINFINSAKAIKIAIDMPSGLHGEKNEYSKEDNIVHADITLTLQFPKLSLLLPENEKFVGKWEILDIGLDSKSIKEQQSNYYYTTEEDIKNLINPRSKFSHKGSYGHALLIAGSLGMAGASILAARATLRSGVGLLSVYTPQCNNTILQIGVPEAMTIPNNNKTHLEESPDTEKYEAIGIGPGLGTKDETKKAFFKLIEQCNIPIVIDADALNILAKHTEKIKSLSPNCIITPHSGEFARFTGESSNRYNQIKKAIEFAQKYNICVVLKGAYTAICTPEGECHFNSTGNPGMATAGSGDILTGITLALLSRRYQITDAARIAVYVHGLAGDIAANNKGETAMTAGDIIEALPSAWKRLESAH